MKVIIFALVIAFASASLFVPNAESDLKSAVPLTGNQANLQTYFDALWDYFGLGTMMQNASFCFSDAQAYAYFASTGYIWQYLGAVNQGNRLQAASFLALAEAFNSTLAPALMCMYEDPSFLDMMFQAGVLHFDSHNFKLLSDIYYYSQFPNYYMSFGPVYTLLAQQQFAEAGYAYGPVLYATVNNASATMINYNFMLGVQNYVFFFYNLTSPTQYAQCYNEETATMEFIFLSQWAGTVANATQATAANASMKYFQYATNNFYPFFEPVVNCLGRTQDELRLVDAIGYDIWTEEWQIAVQNYITNSTSTYYTIFSQMNTAFNNFNPRSVGLLYASFLYAVNSTIPDTSDDDLWY